jgi:hypothetical protein
MSLLVAPYNDAMRLGMGCVVVFLALEFTTHTSYMQL